MGIPEDIFSGIVSNLVSSAFSNLNLRPGSSPPAVPVRSRSTGIVDTATGAFIALTVRRPRGLINVVDEATSSLARGIRRVLYLWTRSPTSGPDIGAPVAIQRAIVAHPIDVIDVAPQRPGLGEALRSFLGDEPVLNNWDSWRDRIVVSLILLGISRGSLYFANYHPRGSRPPATDLASGTLPVLDSHQPETTHVYITSRDGMVVVAISPLAMYMGAIVVLAVLITVWRMRTRRDALDENSKNSRQ